MFFVNEDMLYPQLCKQKKNNFIKSLNRCFLYLERILSGKIKKETKIIHKNEERS